MSIPIIISNVNQLPWGVLHPDAPVQGSSYPTISHYMYASLIKFTPIIYQMKDVLQAKMQCISMYDALLLTIQREALEYAYSIRIDKNLAADLKNTGRVTYNPNQPLPMNAVFLDILQTYVNPVLPVTKEIDNNHPLSPLYAKPFEVSRFKVPATVQKMRFTQNLFIFDTLIQYVYFCYFLYFIGDSNMAYQLCKHNNLEEVFANEQKQYMERQVIGAMQRGCEARFENNPELKKLLNTIPEFQVVDPFNTHHLITGIINYHYSLFLTGYKDPLAGAYVLKDYTSLILDSFFYRDWTT